MAYAAPPVYTSPPPYYGAQAPYMSPWGYYQPGIPMMPQQNMPYIPQYDQVSSNSYFNFITLSDLTDSYFCHQSTS